MSYLGAAPELMAAAAANLESIGSALTEAYVAAAARTTALTSAGADEVSTSVAALFSRHAQAYQALSAEAAALHGQFVRTLTAAVDAYAGAEAAGAASLQIAGNAFGRSAASATPASAVALIMGPSGIPVPPQTYLHGVDDLYVQLLDAGATPRSLPTPEGLYPITGVNSLTFNASVAQGVLALNHAILHQIHSGNHVDVFGYSQSSTLSSLVMSQLSAEHVRSSDVSFILVGDPNNPNGGFLERFVGGVIPSLGMTASGATPSNLYPTTVYTLEYDGFADFPQYPINLLSDLNAYAGMLFTHTTYGNLTAHQISTAKDLGTYGDTTYYMIPNSNLPLLDPLRWIPFGNPLADLLQPDLKVLVDLGYGSTTQGYSTGAPNVATPFGLYPTNISPAEVFSALAQRAPQGVANAVFDLQTGQLTNYSTLQDFYDGLYTFGLIPSEHPTLAQLLGAGATYFNADVPTTPITLASSPEDVVNVLTSVASTDVSTVLPVVDSALAAVTSLPNYDAGLFLANLQAGNLLAAVGDPIAADTALIPFIVGIGGLAPVGEALVTTGYDLVGGLLP